jgi:hypothetical protein
VRRGQQYFSNLVAIPLPRQIALELIKEKINLLLSTTESAHFEMQENRCVTHIIIDPFYHEVR